MFSFQRALHEVEPIEFYLSASRKFLCDALIVSRSTVTFVFFVFLRQRYKIAWQVVRNITVRNSGIKRFAFRRREEKQREKEMLHKMEEERLRREELERQKAEQELRMREAQVAARVQDSYTTYRRPGPRQNVYDVNDDANSHFVPAPSQPSGFAEFSGMYNVLVKSVWDYLGLNKILNVCLFICV